MNIRNARAAGRLAAALLLAIGLGGCVYAPPYAYDSTSGYDGYPAYAGPPVALDLGFSFYDGPRYHGHRHHGWRHHGWSGHRGGHHHRGGWRGGRGRH